MKLIIFCLLLVYSFAYNHPVNEELVDKIKETGLWEPMEPSENPFYYTPLDQIKAMMGTKLDQNDEVELANIELPDNYKDILASNFDARKKWGNKIHPIRDQGKCGSCWAFGATEALSDRYAIYKRKDIILSPQHMVSCDGQDYGCSGGSLPNAWKFMQRTGVPLDSCYPYKSGEDGDSGQCLSQCEDGSELVYYKSDTAKTDKTPFSVMFEISTGGPVEAAFKVYEDFLNYKSGIYQHVEGAMLGGHAVKCIGYGTEKGVDYWLMANSWGTQWGEEGFFKIKQGDCGVNNNFIWALPDWFSHESQ